ncbi:hypothetical protein Trco_006169 [Trichoderma cornu-damae]|uniref:G-protein coupled receptors family 2 profile 2 domain-containing protein n=1 Tax=Trichoderma cornu-damae TaxID=654480 RepID=A0A9P8TTW0_9HYPO|nr:hypothetical protein Trco_006169 [Trichoderma cornu-damae]
MAGLTEAQYSALIILERICSSISMLGCSFTILTFCCSRYFSKSINRLIFYASFGNIITNIGTMISRSYIDQPNSAGCQAQAFIIQTFLPADVLWTLSMAINVYLTFYHKFEARDLRRIEPIYLICCYGIPLVPGFTFLFVKDRGGIRIYGPAISWCWISSEWEILRLAAFYAPTWYVILEMHPISVDEVTSSIPSTDATLAMEAISDPDPSKLAHNTSQPSYTAGSSSETATRPHSVHIATDHSNPSNQYDGTQSADYSASPPHRSSYTPRPNISHSAAPRAFRSIRRRNYERNNAAWSYTKRA